MDLLAELLKADDEPTATRLASLSISEVSAVGIGGNGPAHGIEGWQVIKAKNAETMLADLLAPPTVTRRVHGWTISAEPGAPHVEIVTPSRSRFLVPVGLAESQPDVVVSSVRQVEDRVGKSMPRVYRLREPTSSSVAAPGSALDQAFAYLESALKEHWSRRQIRERTGRFARGDFKGSFFRPAAPRQKMAGTRFFT